MKRFKFFFTAFAAVAVLGFSSCNKDKEDQTITLSTPAEHSHFDRGTMMHVEMKFADDQNLKSYDVEFANQDGSHNHNFHHSDSGSIDGSEYDFHTMIEVPSTAPDMLWLHVTVTDAEGKEVTDSFMYHFDN